MQEDIRILEKFAKNTILYGGRLGLVDSQFEKIKQAIENVLNRVKELEEQNKQLTDAYLRQKDLINAEFLSNYVSKDKIKEKIEELEKDLQDFEQTDNTGRFIRTKSRDYDKKKALEELLEE